MSSLVHRLRKRPDRRPVYSSPSESDDDEEFLSDPNQDNTSPSESDEDDYFFSDTSQDIDQFDETAESEPVYRLRKRPDRRPVYTSLSESDEDDFLPYKNQDMEQFDEIAESEPVHRLRSLEKILDYEMRPMEVSKDSDDSDNVVTKEVIVGQYLVKWRGLSYLHCSWVPEEDVHEACKCIRGFKKRVGSFHKSLELVLSSGEDFVPIHPEWTTVDRIIACRDDENGEKEYLVKFQNLGYHQCYWESESNISTYQKEIQRFMDINSGHRRDKYKGNERNQTDFKQFDHTPEFLAGSLHPYQLEGLNFLRFSWSKQTHVILADEMGLGKTIQSIAFMASLLEENLAPFLVVAPPSTIVNWEREFALWAPHMNVVAFVGNFDALATIKKYDFDFSKDRNKTNSSGDRFKFDVLLTSYQTINKIGSSFLMPIEWKCMIVDEGHQLKNEDSKFSSRLRQYTSMHRVLLTGTPLQNNLNELFALMHFLDPEKFSSLKNFQDEFKDINKEEEISRLHKILAPHLLRRLKKDVLTGIPSKKELILRVDMTIKQKELYKSILTGNFEYLTKINVVRTHVLWGLRKICLHPYMVDFQPECEDANEAYKQFVESSGKLQLLDKMMVKLKEQGHRVLIYSQFQHMLTLLENYCTYKNWLYERIDGRVRAPERQLRIDRFNAENSNRFCFLLSTRAGGLGINLATADTVIIYDSDWNPHADLQAIARAHRIGQTKKVMIYTLINRDTVEERILQIAKKKLLLEHLVVEKLNSELSQGELDDIIRHGTKELFSEGNEDTGASGKIHYDDAAIEKLLDRDHVDEEEVSADGGKENDFLSAFKVANLKYLDDDEHAESKEAQAVENTLITTRADSARYWKDLLKGRYEENPTNELIVLGKRKRCVKRISLDEEYNLAGLELSSDESYKAEPTDDEAEALEHEIPKVRRKTYTRRRKAHNNSEPAPLMEGEGKSLKVLGFNDKQRLTFSQTVMKYGFGDYDWNKFINPLKSKTYEEINAYGILFLQHITEVSTSSTSQTFSDGVPKEGLKREAVLVRVCLISLVKEKLEMFEENPTKPVFSIRIYQIFPALNGKVFWKDEHDKILFHAVIKHGYGKWTFISEDKELGIQKVICKELNLNYYVITNGEHKGYKDVIRKLAEFVARRFRLLEEAIKYEYAEKCQLQEQNSSASRNVEQGGTVINMIDIEDDEIEMLDQLPITDPIGAHVSVEQEEAVINAMVREAQKEIFDQLPMIDPITTEETVPAAVDNKKERVKVARSYEEIYKKLNENNGVNGQMGSNELREKPLNSIFENLRRSLSAPGTNHGERKDSVQNNKNHINRDLV